MISSVQNLFVQAEEMAGTVTIESDQPVAAAALLQKLAFSPATDRWVDVYSSFLAVPLRADQVKPNLTSAFTRRLFRSHTSNSAARNPWIAKYQPKYQGGSAVESSAKPADRFDGCKCNPGAGLMKK